MSKIRCFAALFTAIASLGAFGQTADTRITAPAAAGASRGRIDVDPAFPGDQVAFRTDTTFTIDINVYNAPAFVGFHATVHWDPLTVSFDGLSGPGMFGEDLFPFTTELTASSVKVNTSRDPCGPGVSGSGTLVSLTFSPVVANRQTGFDLSGIEFSGTSAPCVIPPPLIAFNASEARAVVVIGGSTVSALNVNVTSDAASIGTGYRNPRSSAALGNGDISLRSAIQIANLVTGGNRITFRIPGTGNPTIVTTGEPALTDTTGGTYIDGPSQAGGTVQVDGAGGATFTLTSASNTIDKLAVINNPTGSGINITGNSNTVKGCLVGINAAGAVAANLNGIMLSASSGSTIGGAGASANTISGNLIDGIQIASGATGNNIRGNKIGTNAAATARVPNGGDGVQIISTAGINNVIGGSTLDDRNYISGNGANGVYIQALTNQVRGNYIGLNAAGTASLFNAANGVLVESFGNNTIGGATAGERNVISGNTLHGIRIRSGSNNVRGNYIGTNATGALPGLVPNGGSGVVVDTATLNQIGGTAAGERNVISGNTDDGVQVAIGAAGTSILGNHIGTNAAGAQAYPNGGDGVEFTTTAGTGNTCGGVPAGSRNVISGNGANGVRVRRAVQRVIGNYIGVDVNGVGALANALSGVRLEDAAGNEVGGALASERNVISFNTNHGVEITANASAAIVRGNLIGLTVTGAAGGNGGDGVHIDATAGTGSEIGGDTVERRNIISSNQANGVHLASASNIVRGNHVGTSIDGLFARANVEHGVFIEEAASNVIGGVLSAHKNVISGNGGNGVLISGASATSNHVLNNIIGLDSAGNLSRPNSLSGVEINAADSNVVGSASAGNVISGNALDGVRIVESDLSAVRGNTIGLNQPRTLARPNRNGVSITGAAAALNEIGGAIGGQGNIVAGNMVSGVYIDGAGADFNVVTQNTIGTNELFTPIPNGDHGVEIRGGASGNEVTFNQIRGNSEDGVYLAGAGTNDNEILSNKIGEATSPNGGNGVHILLDADDNAVSSNTIRFNLLNGVNIDSADTNIVIGNGIDLNLMSGVLIDGASTGNVIGGLAAPNTLQENSLDGVTIDGDSIANPTIGNTISGNDRDGVRIYAGSFGNQISANSITVNALLGIDLSGDGVTPNDVGDGDGGGNMQQNFPVLVAGPGVINGTLNAAPGTDYAIEFFSNVACDGSGFGEGAAFIGEIAVTTLPTGNVAFAFPVALPAGTVVTATATDPLFNTSEFSMCVVIPAPPACPGDVNGDGVVNLTDLSILLAHFGVMSGATLADGDLNGDGDVDLSDLSDLLANFGESCP
ncbi:MAG: right-handed parallel beta-helix repeat-containing protein [Phycisphaerae bacterium]